MRSSPTYSSVCNSRNATGDPYVQDRPIQTNRRIDRFRNNNSNSSTRRERSSEKPPVTQVILIHEPAKKKRCPSSPTSVHDYRDSSSDVSHSSLTDFELEPKQVVKPNPVTPPLPLEYAMHPHDRQVLQIGPDFWVYLREAEETIRALRTQGKHSLQVTKCACCSERVVCIRDAEFVKCPECSFTNLNGNQLCQGGGGLAVGISLHDLQCRNAQS